MLCLGPAEGKVQGREEPPRQWLVMGKSIKWCWCQTPAGGWAGNEREMSCLGWGQGRARTAWCLHPPGDSFTHHYYMSASQSLLIITVYVISGINIQDSVTLSISSLRRVYLTSRLRLRSVGESPSNWGSQESTVLYCAVLCAPVQAAEIRQCPAITAMLSQMDQRGHQVIVSKKVIIWNIEKLTFRSIHLFWKVSLILASHSQNQSNFLYYKGDHIMEFKSCMTQECQVLNFGSNSEIL